MTATVLIALASLIGLMVFHELGHFVIAKRMRVKVDEFGIGYPPRIFGKKIGETIYSLNLLPFGAFVKMPGEIEKIDDPRSFSRQSVAKRALITAGGVLSFWIIAMIIFFFVFATGAPTAITDQEEFSNAQVQVALVAPSSPAEKAGIRAGDAIREVKYNDQNFVISKINDLQNLADQNKGQEIALTVQRGKNVFETTLTPRITPPQGEGAMGVALVRTAVKSSPWPQAFGKAILETWNQSLSIVRGFYDAVSNLFKGLPSGVQFVGPVGIGNLFGQASQLGLAYYLQFLAMISIYLAVFNILPIPAADGGKLVFLLVERIRGRAINQKIEQNVTAISFALLLILMVFVTIKDVVRLF